MSDLITTEACDLCGLPAGSHHNDHHFDACHDGHAGFSGYIMNWYCSGVAK